MTIKWVEPARRTQRLTRVARATLAERMHVVWQLLEKSAERSETDSVCVHQLRVATRRAAAALEAFAGLLSEKKQEKFRKLLRKLRRKAGNARDLDVLSEGLQSEVSNGSAPLVILTRMVEDRRAAQDSLREARAKMKSRGMPARTTRWIDRLRWREAAREPTFQAAARSGLDREVELFFSQLPADAAEPAVLHELRIRAKRLRYAIEIFAAVLPGNLRESVYPQVVRVQTDLGEINDRRTAMGKLEEWRRRTFSRPGRRFLDERLAQEAARLEEQRAAFLKWWSPARRSRIKGLLVRAVGKKGRPRTAQRAARPRRTSNHPTNSRSGGAAR
jgi:CHAD domain-containing protein